MVMSDGNANTTFFNSSFVPSRSPPPYWIFTVSESYIISFMVCYALILILSVLGNTSIIAIVARNPSMRTTINYLIVNMAATDLAALFAATGKFFSQMHNLSLEWKVTGALGNILCKLCYFIQNVSEGISIHSMVAIAFDRLFAVVFPMRPTPRLMELRVLLPTIWCISLGAFAVYFVIFTLKSPIEGVYICQYEWPSGVDPIKADIVFYLSYLTVFWLIPLTTIAILYTIIALIMMRQTIPGQQSSEAEEARRKQNKSIVKMAFAIVVFFFMCWFPYYVGMLMNLFVWKGSIPYGIDPHLFKIIWEAITMICFISFAINPYICFTFSSKFRKCLKNLFPFSLCFATRIRDPSGVRAQAALAPRHRAIVQFNRTSSQVHFTIKHPR